MKIDAVRKLRQRLANDETTFGLWVTLESASVTEMAVALGLDWVVIDAEHGHLDWQDLVQHLRATVRSQTVALVRIAELNAGLIKRVLDIGADGIVVPWVETAEQLRQAIAYAKFPLDGVRGIGAERATCWGQCIADHTAEANDHVLVVPIIETVATRSEVAKMAQVPGAELFYFGPADYSSTAGYRGQWEGPGVAAQILEMQDTLRRAGKHCGVIATSGENLAERRSQGFRLIGLGMDSGLLIRSLRAMLAAAGRDRPLQTSLVPTPLPQTPLPQTPLPQMPASSGATTVAGGNSITRDGRMERVTPRGQGVAVDLGRGVTLDCQAGAPQQARGITAGIVLFDPGAALPCHRHTFAESLTLLEGAATVDVEGRIHTLKPNHSILIPAGLAHQTRNSSQSSPAVFHVALASDKPTRELAESVFPKRMMPEDSAGHAGGEYVTRGLRGSPDGRVLQPEWLDYFNSRLTPGVTMSGGVVRLGAGCHRDVEARTGDEAICIVSGQATLEVDGRGHALQRYTVALVPAGHRHRLENTSAIPLEFMWFRA